MSTRRLIRFLFGDCAEVLVLKPGETVKTGEIPANEDEIIAQINALAMKMKR